MRRSFKEASLNQEHNLLRFLGIAGYSLRTSVKVGCLFIRPKELQANLARFAQRFVSANDDDSVYQFRHLGTASGIKYRGRYFTLVSNHQRKMANEGNYGIFSETGRSVVTPGKNWVVHPKGNEDRDDSQDFTIFEFEPKLYPKTDIAFQFFDVADGISVLGNTNGIALNLGYPSRLQNVDYFGGNVDLLTASNFVELYELTETENVLRFRTLSEDRLFEDGMSGSPVFKLVNQQGTFIVKWIGMVVRGGDNSRYGRVVCADYLLRQLDQAVFRSAA